MKTLRYVSRRSTFPAGITTPATAACRAMASLNALCTRFINVASAAFEIFRGRRRQTATRRPPIVGTSSTKRRINLKVEVTALNQSAPRRARAPPKRAQFVDNARSDRPPAGLSSLPDDAATPRRSKNFPQNPPRRRSAPASSIHRAIVNEMA